MTLLQRMEIPIRTEDDFGLFSINLKVAVIYSKGAVHCGRSVVVTMMQSLPYSVEELTTHSSVH